MRGVATQGSGYQDTGPLYAIDYVPQDRVLLSGLPVATMASRVGASEVKTTQKRVLIRNRFAVAAEGDEIKGPFVEGELNMDCSTRVVIHP